MIADFINFWSSVHSLICLLLPWVQCQSLKPLLSQCSQTGFVTVDDFIALYTRSYVVYWHGCNVRAWNLFWASVAKLVCDSQLMILLPCILAHMSSIPMGAIYFYMQECFLHLLIPLLFPWVQCIHMQEYSVNVLIMSSIPMGAIYLYIQECFLHSLIWSHQCLPW